MRPVRAILLSRPSRVRGERESERKRKMSKREEELHGRSRRQEGYRVSFMKKRHSAIRSVFPNDYATLACGEN